jgi:hypothetical protein
MSFVVDNTIMSIDMSQGLPIFRQSITALGLLLLTIRLPHASHSGEREVVLALAYFSVAIYQQARLRHVYVNCMLI